MQLLCALGRNWVSRQKVLLKRRKAHNKNRPMSRKRLREERKIMNYSHEMKLLELRKAEDRSKSPNSHLNAIIQELFYPSLPVNSPEDVEKRVQQLGAPGDNLQAIYNNREVMAVLKQYSLPVELLTVYAERGEEFGARNCAVMLERISYYCVNMGDIKKRKMELWEKEVAKLKQKDGKRNLKCPFLFLTREQIPRHPLWASFIQNFTKKLQKITNLEELNGYIESILIIQRIFYYTPAEASQLILSRNANANYSIITPPQISSLLKLLKIRHKVKYTADIKIDTPEEGDSEQNIAIFARKLVTSVLDSPKSFSTEDFINIFKVVHSRKRRINLLTQQQLARSEEIVTSVLSSLSFQDNLCYLGIYTLLYKKPSAQFLQLLKFDLYRKVQQCRNVYSFLTVMNRMEGRQLVFHSQGEKGTQPPPPVRIPAYDLMAKVANTMVPLLPKLKVEELTKIIDTFYANQIENNQMRVAQVVAAEIVKKGKECSLQQLGKTFFKLSLLGHRSKTLAKFVFQQYVSRYHKEMKRLSEEETFLLPTDQPQISSTTNLGLIHLQECLIMSVWSLIEQFSDRLPKQVNLDELLLLIPVDLQSREPLIYELVLQISAKLDQYSMFPNIKLKDTVEGSDRLSEFYRANFAKTDVQLLMEEQARLTGDFINTYNPKQQRFLPQKWSKSKTYSLQQYLVHAEKEPSTSYFSPLFKLPEQFLSRRNPAITAQLKKTPRSKGFFSSVGKPTPRMYDLL